MAHLAGQPARQATVTDCDEQSVSNRWLCTQIADSALRADGDLAVGGRCRSTVYDVAKIKGRVLAWGGGYSGMIASTSNSTGHCGSMECMSAYAVAGLIKFFRQ
jgi:hypothetical protein